MTTPSIPASAIVNVTPGVIGAGGTGLDLNGLILTDNNSIPYGIVRSYPDAASVARDFGNVAAVTLFAQTYFAGFDNSNIKPAALLVAFYADSASYPLGAQARLFGARLNTMTLAQLQALSGVLTFTVDGQTFTSDAISFSGATSFSNAAALISAGMHHYDAVVTGSIAGTTLTVSAVSSGAIMIGHVLEGTGVTGGTRVIAMGTGTGGTGTYTVDTSQTVSSTAISAGKFLVGYSSVQQNFTFSTGASGPLAAVSFASGSLAAPLGLTSATGAVQSVGAATSVPGTFMDLIVAQTQDFASFMTSFKPSIADMVLFSAWTGGTGNRYVYAMWDNDSTVTTNADTASAGYQIIAAGYSGTVPVYDPTNGGSIAAFVMGAIASIDPEQTEGRTNLDFRSQTGLTAGVTDATIRLNLIANGYNFYGAFATANDRFVFFNPGSITGPFDWIDSFINQIWMNNGFQLALMGLLTGLRSIPYNAAGYGLIEQAMLDQVNAAVNFGAIRAGVTLSALQAAEVNAAAGLRISDTLQQRGWYIQVKDASPTVRAARGSPPVTFWYTDGQSIQTINLASVEVQ